MVTRNCWFLFFYSHINYVNDGHMGYFTDVLCYTSCAGLQFVQMLNIWASSKLVLCNLFVHMTRQEHAEVTVPLVQRKRQKHDCNGTVCSRALQFPPEGWLRMGLNNGSITWLTIRPSGRVGLRSLGDSGFMPPDKLTRTWRTQARPACLKTAQNPRILEKDRC